jgi:hypothetical protein
MGHHAAQLAAGGGDGAPHFDDGRVAGLEPASMPVAIDLDEHRQPPHAPRHVHVVGDHG